MPSLIPPLPTNDDDTVMPYEPALVTLHDLSPILDTSVFAEVHPTSTERDDDDDDDDDDDNDIVMHQHRSDDDRNYSLGQIASVAQSQSAARVRRRRNGGIVGGGTPLRRQRGFYQLDMPPWLLRTRRTSMDGITSSGSETGSNDDDDYVDLLQASHDYHHRRRGNNTSSSNNSTTSRDPRLLRRTHTRVLSRRNSNNHNNCVGETAVDLSRYSKKSERQSVSEHQVLDFDIVMDDGGQYKYDFTADDGGSLFGVDNILRNDDSVYCSGRSGTINILLQYCGSGTGVPLLADKSCVISQIVIKSPQHGFTAPCKEGLFFISYHPIDVDGTTKFDHFTQSDYERYVRLKGGPDMLDDSDPVAWFSMSSDKQDAIRLNDRVGKYVLIKLLRAEGESENIDLQYVALIGYSGARAFASARIC
ncbi:hypothetical protein BJV82DRAFT_670467 [Fennellomyces sp. T-0311]|nr:hypothetical protein BJV82DRAFT_670467 [Fennellomyces sp. T-0311]